MKRYILLLVILFNIINSWGQSSNQNYILTRSYLYQTNSEYIESIQYFDGFGRPVQTVQKGITPLRNDLVTYQEYDLSGRDSSSWLPRPASGNNGAFVELNRFKNLSPSIYGNDSKPYSENKYEPSPLSRVVEQYGPGQDWHNNGKSVKTTYTTNRSNIYYYTVSGIGVNAYISGRTFYGFDELFCIEIEDEDGNVSYEFKDKSGKVVLTRQINSNVNHDTYYLYDDFGNLCYVLPPMMNGNYTTDLMGNMPLYAYVYKYDERNRCIKKRIPGSDWIEYIYDNADRLIFSQDGEQRIAATDPGSTITKGRWTFYVYDVLGRVVLTGECENVSTQGVVKGEYKGAGYENYGGYQLSGIGFRQHKIHTINIYDNYNFINTANFVNLKYVPESGYNTRYKSDADKLATKGLLTGKAIALLDGSDRFIYETYYYDERGRVIQARRSNPVGPWYDEYISYNFSGQPVKKKLWHSESPQKNNKPLLNVYEYYRYNYDHGGRLKNVYHQLNEQNILRPEVPLTSYNYDEIGRLSSKSLDGTANFETTYTYNLRSWVTGILGKHFTEKIYYNQPIIATHPKYYNGNIAATIQTPTHDGGNDNWFGYGYVYDNLSRLTHAKSYYSYGNNSVDSWGCYDALYTYDKNGNMLTLNRINNYFYNDKLTLTYNGNQVRKAKDSPDWDSMQDFINYSGNTSAAGYLYNKNGALSEDKYKGSVNTYSSIGTPLKVSVPKILGTIDYIYTAEGEKLQASYQWHSSLSLYPIQNTGTPPSQPNKSLCRVYAKNLELEDGSIKRIFTENGYYENGLYYYYYKDHLGNNAVVVNQSGQKKQYLYLYPFGVPVQESSGTNYQPYKFGGKELDTMHGLNVYDFHARQYDPAIGRFMSIDPLAEKYYSISPYVYCANNPVKFVDLRGDSISLAKVQEFDKANGTTYTQNIINDLQSQTGLAYSISKTGNLEYNKDKDGNAIVATRKDENGNVTKVGSSEARNLITGAIDHSSTVYTRISTSSTSNAHIGGNLVRLNPGQINGFVNGSVGVDNRTLGWGMTFMHEISHSIVGGGLADSPYNPGPVVTRMNIIRQQLNDQGGNYGQRSTYYSYPIGSNKYIPMDSRTAVGIRSGIMPLPIDKYISF